MGRQCVWAGANCAAAASQGRRRWLETAINLLALEDMDEGFSFENVASAYCREASIHARARLHSTLQVADWVVRE